MYSSSVMFGIVRLGYVVKTFTSTRPDFSFPQPLPSLTLCNHSLLPPFKQHDFPQPLPAKFLDGSRTLRRRRRRLFTCSQPTFQTPSPPVRALCVHKANHNSAVRQEAICTYIQGRYDECGARQWIDFDRTYSTKIGI